MGNEHGSENVSTHPLAQNQSVIFRMFNILWSLGFCYNTCSCKPDKIIYCKDQNAFLNGFLNRNHCKSSKDQTNIWHLLLEREKQLVRQLDIAYERKFQISAECDHDLVYFLGDNFNLLQNMVRNQSCNSYVQEKSRTIPPQEHHDFPYESGQAGQPRLANHRWYRPRDGN